MRRKLIGQKKELLKRISLHEYRELLSFIEKVYLSEEKLKILKARKFSNLYFSLIELVREEDGGRVRKLYEKKFGNNPPIVISDRALAYYIHELREGVFDTVLIVDDIIIHGRTLSALYDKIEEVLPASHSINLYAYAVNKDDLIKRDYIQKAYRVKNGTLGDCRGISDKLVDIFYMLGQPCTSYVPNIEIDLNSDAGKAIIQFLEEHKQEILKMEEDSDVLIKTVSYAWTSPESWNNSLTNSIRFYVDNIMEKCIVVPMIAMKPLEKNEVDKYYQILSPLIMEEFTKKISNQCEEYEKIYFRAILYVLSSLWGREFFGKYNIVLSEKEGELVEKEKLNFGTRILNQTALYDTENYIAQLQKIQSEEITTEEILKMCKDFKVLDEVAIKLEWENVESEREFVGRFLNENGILDEKAWKERQSAEECSKRLAGYPISLLMKKMKQNYGDVSRCFNALLAAIDRGKGSIVVHKFKNNQKTYFISLLHDGEQNYKYIEKKYFPFLYGLFRIEKEKQSEKYCKELKKTFVEEYKKYWIEKKKDYVDEHIKALLETNIKIDYESVLIHDGIYYSDEEALEKAVKLSEELIRNAN